MRKKDLKPWNGKLLSVKMVDDWGQLPTQQTRSLLLATALRSLLHSRIIDIHDYWVVCDGRSIHLVGSLRSWLTASGIHTASGIAQLVIMADSIKTPMSGNGMQLATIGKWEMEMALEARGYRCDCNISKI